MAASEGLPGMTDQRSSLRAKLRRWWVGEYVDDDKRPGDTLVRIGGVHVRARPEMAGQELLAIDRRYSDLHRPSHRLHQAGKPIDALTDHASGDEGDKYGLGYSLPTLAAAIAKLPSPVRP